MRKKRYCQSFPDPLDKTSHKSTKLSHKILHTDREDATCQIHVSNILLNHVANNSFTALPVPRDFSKHSKIYFWCFLLWKCVFQQSGGSRIENVLDFSGASWGCFEHH